MAHHEEQPTAIGSVVEDASAASRGRFVNEAVELGSALVTDGWQPYATGAHDIRR